MPSKTTNKFSPEVRARAVRMVLDHEGEHASQRSQHALELLFESLIVDGGCDTRVRMQSFVQMPSAL